MLELKPLACNGSSKVYLTFFTICNCIVFVHLAIQVLTIVSTTVFVPTLRSTDTCSIWLILVRDNLTTDFAQRLLLFVFSSTGVFPDAFISHTFCRTGDGMTGDGMPGQNALQNRWCPLFCSHGSGFQQ